MPSGARDGSKRVCWARRTNGARPLPPRPRRPLGRRELVERAAEVHRRGSSDLGRAPGDRLGERPVELERARAVAVAAQRALVALGEAAVREAEQLARRNVGEHDVGFGKLVDRARRVNLDAVLDEACRRAHRSAVAHRHAGSSSRRRARGRAARARSRRSAAARAGASSARRRRRRTRAPARSANVDSASDRAAASARSAARGPSSNPRRASARADGGSGPISTGSTSRQCSASGPTSAR